MTIKLTTYSKYINGLSLFDELIQLEGFQHNEVFGPKRLLFKQTNSLLLELISDFFSLTNLITQPFLLSILKVPFLVLTNCLPPSAGQTRKKCFGRKDMFACGGIFSFFSVWDGERMRMYELTDIDIRSWSDWWSILADLNYPTFRGLYQLHQTHFPWKPFPFLQYK